MRAIAVEFARAGSNMTESVTVGREVVVSAGTIGTPKVFELSGIGNSRYVFEPSRFHTRFIVCRSILRAAGVNPVLELPSVGENLAGKYCSQDIVFSTDILQTTYIATLVHLRMPRTTSCFLSPSRY